MYICTYFQTKDTLAKAVFLFELFLVFCFKVSKQVAIKAPN
jgi:hypothetical protein